MARSHLSAAESLPSGVWEGGGCRKAGCHVDKTGGARCRGEGGGGWHRCDVARVSTESDRKRATVGDTKVICSLCLRERREPGDDVSQCIGMSNGVAGILLGLGEGWESLFSHKTPLSLTHTRTHADAHMHAHTHALAGLYLLGTEMRPSPSLSPAAPPVCLLKNMKNKCHCSPPPLLPLSLSSLFLTFCGIPNEESTEVMLMALSRPALCQSNFLSLSRSFSLAPLPPSPLRAIPVHPQCSLFSFSPSFCLSLSSPLPSELSSVLRQVRLFIPVRLIALNYSFAYSTFFALYIRISCNAGSSAVCTGAL